MELQNAIEAILFYQAEPLHIKRLAALVKKDEPEVRAALILLEEKLRSTGLRLLQNGDEVTLGTSPDASALIEAITKEELSKDLSKASLETLAIVLYKGPITRAEVDYIRGVNSTFILRNLLVRGLVEKVENPADQRSFLYKPTLALFEYMGITKTDELPEYHDTMATLEGFLTTKEAEETAQKEEVISSPETAEGEDEISADDMVLDSNIEADILEEDEAGENYDDEPLQEHRGSSTTA